MPKIEYTKNQYIKSDGCHSGQDVFRPMLQIALESDTVVLGKFLPCLVDSGADWSMFPLEFLEELEIDKSGLGIDYPKGAGEGYPAYFASVTIHAPEMGVDCKWIAVVAFSESLNGQGYGMLGHKGFFERFKVLFDRPNFCFEILP